MAEDTAAAGSPHLIALLSRAPVCAGENKAQYEQLRDLIFNEVNPTTVSEYMLACDIAVAQWELLRLHGFKAGIVNANGRVILTYPSIYVRGLSEDDYQTIADLFCECAIGDNAEQRQKLKWLLYKHNLSFDEAMAMAFEKCIAAQAQTDHMVNSAFRRREAAYAELDRRRSNPRRRLDGSEPKQIEAAVIDGDTTSIVPDAPSPAG